jgi:hypothetical protein
MGAAGKVVGYLCPGTCLDYAYDDLSVINYYNNYLCINFIIRITLGILLL